MMPLNQVILLIFTLVISTYGDTHYCWGTSACEGTNIGPIPCYDCQYECNGDSSCSNTVIFPFGDSNITCIGYNSCNFIEHYFIFKFL